MSNTWLNLKRVSKAGFVNFWRSGLVSFTSVFVMTVTLFMVGSLIIFNAFLDASLSEIESKVDINVYFNTDASEEDILTLRQRLNVLPEVKEVEYVTREQALTRFIERNKDNSLIISSIEELQENPLGAVLNVRAVDPSQYEQIANFLDEQMKKSISEEGSDIIDTINYFQNKLVIDRLSRLIDGVENIGIVISVTLMIMAVLVTFNTIRLAIYNTREEIEVMKLVGAGRGYIRGPFIIEGLMYGLLSSLIALLALYPASVWITSSTSGFFGGLNLTHFYQSNLPSIALTLLSFGLILGSVSSFVAVRRYLNYK